jgi:hypothetical protein
LPIKDDKPSDQELFGEFYDPSFELGNFVAENMACAC